MQNICNRCVMDTSSNDIKFYQVGCNFCSELIDTLDNFEFKDKKKKDEILNNLIKDIKKKGKGKKYDCIVGVSGGIDSSYVLLKAIQYGLRPLAVHMDNGWNSETSQNNINVLIKNLGVDLYTHVIDWDEYKRLMYPFLDADVVDLELLMDNAMLAVNFRAAKKYNLEFILSGTNLSTEGMRMPKSWAWNKFDKKNIQSIAKTHGIKKFKTYPSIGNIEYVYYYKIKKIKWILTLDYLNYKKENALIELKEIGYKPYYYKHYESYLTRFYQGYLLPKKFGIDKRKLHFSTLIITGQMSREAALIELKKLPYPDQAMLETDTNYFLKKLNWTEDNLEDYLNRPRVEHDYYKSEVGLYNILFEKNSKLKKISNILKYFLRFN